MSLPLTVNSIVYNYPEQNDEGWGQQATLWAQAVTSVISHLRSPSLPIATTGQIRLGNTDSIAWRNFANSNNIKLFTDNSNRLIYDDGVTQKDLSLTGGGNVQHLAASTDNELPRFDGVSGGVIQVSGVFIDDNKDVTGVRNLTTTGDLVIADDITFKSNSIELAKVLPPIGTIIPHYDFNGLFVPDSAYWVPCDGTSQIVGGGAQTTPDLSNRYLVGFGTEGGGDNDTAAWDTAAVGDASHQINLAHTHDVNPASFTSGAGSAHSHSNGSYVAEITYSSSDSRLDANITTATSWTSDHRLAASGDGGSAGGSFTTGANVQGTSSTESAHTHSINVPDTTSTSALSSTQSIQPRSIRVRFYMRGK